VHEEMKPGENGVYLTVMVEGKPISETLTLIFPNKRVKTVIVEKFIFH